MILVIQIFWLMLPAGIANIAASLSSKTNFLNYPIDFNKTWRGERIFGDHKTWRGFFFGVLAAILTAYLQSFLNFSFSLANYQQINIFYLGFLLGFGALLGDLIKSGIKRRKKIAPGKVWAPFDQLDWAIGSLILINFYLKTSWEFNLTALLFLGALHPIVNYLGYLLKFKKNKF